MAEIYTTQNISYLYKDLLVSKVCKIITKKLTLAAATDLDLGALLKYNKAYATGTVTFNFSSATAGDEIPAGTIVTTNDGVQFATDTLWTAAGTETTVDRTVTAVNPGTSGNKAIGTIVNVATPVDVTITSITNAAATTGGTDSTDVALWSASDPVTEIMGVHADQITGAIIGDHPVNVVVEGILNLARVQATLGSVPSDAIVEQLESIKIYLSGTNQ